MPLAPLATALLVIVTTGIGVVHLMVGGGPWNDDAAALGALGLILFTVVTVAGTLIARSRWARNACIVLALTWLGVAAASPLSASSSVLLGSIAAVLVAATGPWLGRWLRRLPAAQGPPPRAVGALLFLLAVPAVAGLSAPGGVAWPSWALSGWSVLLAYALARGVSPALWGIRLAHPALSLAAGATAGLASVVLLGIVGVSAAVLGWTREVALAVTPLRPRRSEAVPFPPELVPPEVLRRAGLDERGRRSAPPP